MPSPSTPTTPTTPSFVAALRERVAPPANWGTFRTGARPATVVAALYIDGGEWHIPFVTRRDDAPDHPGQVALPGGTVKPGEDAWQAAAREVGEEIGADPELLEPLGAGAVLYTAITNFCVVPWLAVLHGPRPEFVHQPSELTGVLEIPLDRLLDGSGWIEADAGSILGRHFPWQASVVWGLTGYILADLLPRLAAARDASAAG